MLAIVKQEDGNYNISYNELPIGRFVKNAGIYQWSIDGLAWWDAEQLYAIADALSELNELEEGNIENTVNPTTPPPK